MAASALRHTSHILIGTNVCTVAVLNLGDHTDGPCIWVCHYYISIEISGNKSNNMKMYKYGTLTKNTRSSENGFRLKDLKIHLPWW